MLRTIRDVFDAEDFLEPAHYDGPEGGQRRHLVGSYHHLIDPTDDDQQRRLLRVYLHAVDEWGRDPFDGTLDTGAQALIRSLRRDGAAIDEDGNLLEAGASPVALPLDEFERLSQPDVLVKHLERISANLAQDPAAAIASAKELVESTCRFILDDYNVEHKKSADLLDLYRAAAVELKINREAVPGSRRGSESAQRILQNLATTVQSMAELRNELGLGHGRTANSPAIERHARLSFNAARTVVEFMLQTWHERKRKGL